MAIETHRHGWPSARPGFVEDWESTREALDWMKRNTPDSAVIGANLDPMVFLYTGRKSIRLFNYNQFDLFYGQDPKRRPLGDGEDLRRHLLKHQVRYLLLTPMPAYRESTYLKENVAELRQRHPDALQSVAGFSRPGYALFEVRAELLRNTTAE
jgi:hypothetical protein